MLEQDLKNIWKGTAESKSIKIEKSHLFEDLEGEMTELKKGIKKRDRREIAASVFGLLLFGYLAYEVPFIISKVGCGLNILWFIYLVFKLRTNRNKKRFIDLTWSLWKQLETEKVNIKQEIALLNSVLYWYILPPLLANVLFIYGFGDPMAYNWNPVLIQKFIVGNLLHVLPISLHSKIAYIIGMLGFNAFVFWINKRTVGKVWLPKIKEIEKVQLQLEE